MALARQPPLYPLMSRAPNHSGKAMNFIAVLASGVGQPMNLSQTVKGPAGEEALG